jgi:hypothetical protein
LNSAGPSLLPSVKLATVTGHCYLRVQGTVAASMIGVQLHPFVQCPTRLQSAIITIRASGRPFGTRTISVSIARIRRKETLPAIKSFIRSTCALQRSSPRRLRKFIATKVLALLRSTLNPPRDFRPRWYPEKYDSMVEYVTAYPEKARIAGGQKSEIRDTQIGHVFRSTNRGFGGFPLLDNALFQHCKLL